MKRHNADRILAIKVAFARDERLTRRTSVQGDPQTKWQVVEIQAEIDC